MTPRILIVDDDAGLRKLMRTVFRREGFEVVEAADGMEALARALDSAPSVILLDVMMPGLNGINVCHRLKSDRRTNRVPVVFVSAIEDMRHRNETLKLGADDCIGKPVGTRELVMRVKGVMERRRISLDM